MHRDTRFVPAVTDRHDEQRPTMLRDSHDHPLSGATALARDDYVEALHAFQCWRADATALAERALVAAPAFVMAYVLRSWLALCGRDRAAASIARPLHAAAARLPSSDRERRHLAAIGAALDDDHERCSAELGRLLDEHPRDLLALQVAHALDYLTGETGRMLARAAGAARHASPGMPGFHAVVAMQAFALEENAQYARAEALALEALALEPRDARAVHSLAHVYEMTARPSLGLRLLGERTGCWAIGTTVATHCWWHAALFHLDEDRTSHVLALYDRRLAPHTGSALSDLIDAASLLWRLRLRGIDGGARWRALADAWAPRIRDQYCTFSDLHAMLAFVGAGDEPRAMALLRTLARVPTAASRYGRTTREIGVPAARALAAFGRGDYVAAIEGLAPLTATAPRLGGSHAQRDVLPLTLREAVDRARAGRPAVRRAA
jgi:hypothetical protein